MTNQFLKFFLPSALLLGLLVAALQYHGHAIDRESLMASQAHGVALAAEAIGRDFETAGADLQALTASRSLRRFAGQPGAGERRLAADDLSAFIRPKRIYSNVSYVSIQGQRLLSLGRGDAADQSGGGQPPPVFRELLSAVRNLPPTSVAVSRLMLGADDRPTPQAAMLFAAPVYDLAGRLRGALVLTYAGSRLTSHLGGVLGRRPGSDILINQEGHWLQYSDDEQRWIVPDERPFDEAYPDAWRHMLAADGGLFQTRKGLFAFTTVHPGVLTDVAPLPPTSAPADAPPQFWKIASLTPARALAAAAAARFWRGMLIYLLLLIPTAVACRYIAGLADGRRRSQQRLRELGTVVEQSHDMVLITDATGIVRYVNPRFEAITGYGRQEIIGKPPGLLKSGTHDADFYRRLWETIRRGEAFQAMFTNRKKTGELFHVQMTIGPLTDESGITGYVATGKDITSQIHTQERLLKLAFHHPLTELPNRALFRDHLQEAAARARRSGHSVAVLFIDLDRFKKVNDSLGHQAGDALLKQVAHRLREAVREIDMVAHLGGDEFTVLLDGIQQSAHAHAVARKLLQLFEQPFDVADRQLYIGASIGIAVFPNDSDNVEKLMEQADTAMYQAKRAGRSQYQFYSTDMTTLANERLELENRLRAALTQREFELHFQPIVDPLRRELRGLEALIRWRQPDGSLQSPNHFVPVLEETGLIVPVTEWVLEEACRQCRRLQDAGTTQARMNVNISARSFYQSDLVKTVGDALRQARLAPTQLVLEVTESLLLEDQRHVQKALDQLRELGVGIAIDDFGTGYSSLAYLKRLPVNILKIDRAFIHGVTPGSRDTALVSAMLAMAQELQMDVVAEGVEQPHQLDFLRQRRCDGAQGYLFSAPLPADNVAAWLDRDRRWPWKPWMDESAVSRLH